MPLDNPSKIKTKCSACGKFLSPAGAAACGVCPSLYHRACVSISDAAALSRDWSCPECKKKTRKANCDNTPIRSAGGGHAQDSGPSREVTPVPSPAVAPAPAVPPTASSASLTTMAADAAAAAQGVAMLRCELAEYAAEMRDFRNEMAEQRVIVAGVKARLEGMERRLEELERRESVPPPDVTELERTVEQLRKELDDRDQDALLSDLEIGQLPEDRGENIGHVVTVLAAKLGVQIDERDIVFAERVGAMPAPPGRSPSDVPATAPRSRRVVVRMARRSLRDELLRAARVRRTLSVADAGSSEIAPNGRIFLNERLTRNNRQLFHRVRELCRRHQWRYSWTKRGRIFIRQTDGQPAYQIRSDADLKRVIGPALV